jgi:outer membrane protein TolC
VRLSSEGLEAPPTPVEPRLRGLQSQGLWNRLDVRRLLLEYAAAEAVLQREILGQYPDFRLVPGYEWEEGEKRFIIGASVELPLFDRNQGRILQALARRKELGARFLALQADAIGEIDEARASYSPALQGLDEADRTLASLDAAQRAVATAVELGAEEPLELARSRARVAAARLARVDALESAWTAVSMLEDAVGRPLDSSFFDPPSFDRGDPLVRGDAAGKESVHP